MLYKLEVQEKCIQCDNCRVVCPDNAVIQFQDSYAIDPWSCSLCMICVEVCPVDVIKLTEISTEDLI